MTYFNSDFQGIAWIDVESTGLNPYEGEKLLQVACYVTDPDLNILDETGFEEVLYFSKEEAQEVYDNSIPFVQNMHTVTGLWERLPEGKALTEVDTALKAYINQFYSDKRTVWLGGNSIVLDRNFTNFYLPETSEFLHYRSVDVTSFAGLARCWYGYEFEKKKTHNAKDDIMESLEELRALRKILFK